MAGSNPKKEARGQKERLVPGIAKGPSRVSRAAGSLSGRNAASDKSATRMEQRSSSSSGKQRSQLPASGRSGQGGRSSQSSQSSRKGTSSARPARPSPGASYGPSVSSRTPDAPKDTQITKWAYDKWNNLEPHHQQGVFSFILLLLALLMFASLTIFSTAPVLNWFYKFFTAFLGWSAYPLALGLVAFALAHLIEGIRKKRFIRWSLVIGLTCAWLLLMVESCLITGQAVAGALGWLLASPLLGWKSPFIGHVIVLGLLIISLVVAFRITFGHVLMVGNALQRLSGGTSAAKEEEAQPSPYLGSRPKYSRYVNSGAIENKGAAVAQSRQVARVRTPVKPRNDDEFEDDEETAIDFEPDFEDDDDPLNDINLHKQEIGSVPRGARPQQQLDPKEHAEAVRGVSQQPLPLEQSSASSTRRAAAKVGAMEPLQPNPLRAGQSAPAAKNAARQPRAAQVAQADPASSSPWQLPETSLLHNPDEIKMQMLGDDTGTLARMIQETLRSFRVDAEVRQEDISIGPTVIRFGIRPTGKPETKLDEKSGKMLPVRDNNGNIIYETRTRVSRIMALQNDLALVLEAKTIRMEAPVPGRPYVGVEIPNKNSRLVTLREVLESKEYQVAKAKSKLTVALGKDVAGLVRVGDLARMPHLLIAGATGAGKSVCINTIISSILTQATPDDVRMLMVDPKMVELNMYNGIPHLLSPVVIEVDKVVSLLKNAINEMERRYRLFSQLGVRNLDGYRKLRLEKSMKGDNSLANLPAIVIIIDELADLMMAAPEEVEGMICRLAQLARATGIHLVVATQRPSVDVITGLIKANIPTRISFMVSSAVDSRTIIDMGGAERLLGRGDMLYLPADAGRPERIQGSFLADDEAETLVHFWRQQIIEHMHAAGPPASDPALAPTTPMVEPGWEIKEVSSDDFELDDNLLDRAEEVVREFGKASISLLQRRLRIGYSRAARLIDLLEERGIIGQAEQGGRVREILDGNGSGGNERHGGGDGRTMADEVADIVAEEKARDEFLKKQAARLPPPGPGQGKPPAPGT